MALVLLDDVQRLVAHMSYSGSSWSNSLLVFDESPGELTGSEGVVDAVHDFFQGCTPEAGFIETISGYRVYQHHEGDAEIDHPPLFTNTYHEAGTKEAHFNGAAIGSPLPKDVVVFAKLATSGGRSGKLFIRNLLEEPDVDSAVSGTWEFTAGSTRFTVARFATLVGSTIANYFAGGSSADEHTIRVGHLLNVKTADTRPAYSTAVTACTAIRPAWNKQHH